MAKAQELTSIKLLVEDEERRTNNTSETNTPVESVTEAQDASEGSNAPDNKSITGTPPASEKAPKEMKPRRRKGEKNETKKESRGITSKSPVVHLLEEEKRLIKRLEAHILLETGETVTDHQLIMDAVREYTRKHHPDF